MIIGDYKVLKLLGRGGVGRVFLAQSQKNQCYYAIKETYCRDNDSNARFRREYNFLSAIDHPNIVRAHDFFTLGDKHFMVMEYVEGVSLSDFIKSNPKLPTKDLLAIAVQIARAVEVVNATGIVHRDIKPDNIMIDSKKCLVKILDLGMGKHLDSFCQSQALTKAGAVVGTLDYMSPEQMNGQLYDNSDVFSVGATLYQLFSWQNRSIFASESILHTMNNITNKRVPAFPTNDIKRNEISTYKSIHLVLKRALHKDLTKRTASCRELSQKLNKIYLQTRGRSTWKPSSNLDRQSILSLEKTRETYLGAELPSRTNRFKKRKKNSFQLRTWSLCLTLFVIVVACIAMWSTQKKSVQTFAELLKQMQEYEERCDYKKLCHVIHQLDTTNDSHFFYQYKPRNDKEKFIRLFYNKSWDQKATDLGAKLLRTEHSVLNLLYNIRLLTCKGEFSLATWYAGVVYEKYPDFFALTPHPIFKVAIHKHYDAFQMLRSWKISQRLTIEKDCCQFFLDIVHLKLYEGQKLGRWNDYELPQTMRNSFFLALYRYLKIDFCEQVSNKNTRNRFLIVQKAAHQIPNYKNLHYVVNRIAALQVELQKSFVSIEKNLRPFIDKYPDFLPSKILVYDIFAELKKSQMMVLRDRGNYEEIKGTTYQCILAYLKSNDIAKQRVYINFLYENFPVWHFSYVYKARIESAFTAAMIYWQGFQLNYRIFGKHRIQWHLFNREQRFCFALEVKWLRYVLRDYSTMPIAGYQNILPQLEQFYQGIITAIRRTYPQDKKWLKFLLLNEPMSVNAYQKMLHSQIPGMETHVVRHAIMAKKYDVAGDLLQSKRDIPLECCALIFKYRNTRNEEDLQRIIQLLGYCSKNIDNIKYQAIFNLQCQEITAELIRQERYSEASEVRKFCYNNNYISATQRLLYVQQIQDKLKMDHLSHSPHAKENNVLLQKYVDKKLYDKAQELMEYNGYIMQLQKLPTTEVAKFENIVQRLQVRQR